MDYSKFKIMVIDDEQAYLKYYHVIIKNKLDAEVVEAINPKIAFEYLKNNDLPDLIILDMQMPVMDGHTALKYLRNNKKTQDIPVIISTALKNKQLVASLLRLRISDYIVKPTNKDLVIQKIKKVLDNIE